MAPTLVDFSTNDFLFQVLNDVVESLKWSSVMLFYDTIDNLALSEGFLNNSALHVTTAKITRNSDVR